MKIWTRVELHLENDPQDLLAPSILSAKKTRPAVSSKAVLHMAGLDCLVTVILLNISGFLGRVEGLEWKMRRPSLAMLNLNNMGLSRLHFKWEERYMFCRAREKPGMETREVLIEPKSE